MAYVVEVTEEAAAAAPAVAEYRAEVGERVRFESKADADALVEKFNAETGTTLRLRSVHEDRPLEEGQEPVDGYLEVARSGSS
jgi:hypothetical protein